jgi:quinol monooxygenase YgiN
MPLTRVVRLTFMPDRVNEFLEIFRDSVALIRSSEGCRGVRLMRDADSPNVFFTISLWESAGHLERYRDSELFRDTWAHTKVLFAAPPLAHSTFDTEL